MSVASSYANFEYSNLPLRMYKAGEVVLAAGSSTGQLLFLKEGTVAVIMRGIQIAIVDEPGAVFGELSALLDLPHSAEVRALAPSQFHVANASLIGHNAAALFYVAGILARRLHGANEGLRALLQSRGAGGPQSAGEDRTSALGKSRHDGLTQAP
ncbi:MAG TPA: cyclic nucleotide-binding domain-containing protein [Pseudolabrys sp.]|nr:cyclic nucleotide-binding domain-containing protein [Pseudolabrys sp.]